MGTHFKLSSFDLSRFLSHLDSSLTRSGSSIIGNFFLFVFTFSLCKYVSSNALIRFGHNQIKVPYVSVELAETFRGVVGGKKGQNLDDVYLYLEAGSERLILIR